MHTTRPAARLLAAGTASVLGIALVGVAAAPASADPFTVDTADELVQAISDANGTPGGDVITLDGPITLTGDLPPIGTDLEIIGGEHAISAAGFGTFVFTSGVTARIEQLEILNSGGHGITSTDAELELDDVLVDVSEGDGLHVEGGSITVNDSEFTDGAGLGAFIETTGAVTITDSDFERNDQGGLFVEVAGEAVVEVAESVADGNVEFGFEFIGGDDTQFTLDDLTAEFNGQGIRLETHGAATVVGNRWRAAENLGGNGVLIDATDVSSIELADSISTQNWAVGVAIDAEGSATIDLTRFDSIDNGDDGYLVDESGIAAAITIAESTIADNDERGLGAEPLTSPSALTIERSTIAGNAGIGVWAGMYNADVRFAIRNSTVSGNGAGADCVGGIEITADSTGTFELLHSTVWQNPSAECPQVGLIDLESVVVSHTIIAGTEWSFATDGDLDVTMRWTILDAIGLSDSDPNLADELEHPSNIIDDPLLGPLAENGGPTPTHLLLDGSPALDGGDPDFAGDPELEQRGLLRVAGEAIDIGAVEMFAEAPAEPEEPGEDPGNGPGDEDPAALPATGADSTGIALAALLLLVAGATAVGARRMRRA